MHDLKNLAAKQSLVVQNAEKHKHDPKFIDDAIATIANAVSHMHKLLEQLSNVSKQSKGQNVILVSVMEEAVKRSLLRQPQPTLIQDIGSVTVSADPDRLCGVLEHLVRNAQDATDADGSVTIQVGKADKKVSISIRDTGCGMTDDFINERLFRPFDSTKGSQSMGIGAYQAREYIQIIGGQLDVASEPGVGTTFTIQLPTTS
jgi:putative PEP-CTERM system histidine kinase